jgi:hypothetical protein
VRYLQKSVSHIKYNTRNTGFMPTVENDVQSQSNFIFVYGVTRVSQIRKNNGIWCSTFRTVLVHMCTLHGTHFSCPRMYHIWIFATWYIFVIPARPPTRISQKKFCRINISVTIWIHSLTYAKSHDNITFSVVKCAILIRKIQVLPGYTAFINIKQIFTCRKWLHIQDFEKMSKNVTIG